MCLHKIHKFPKIAWKPITCYKVVISCGGTYFWTLYTKNFYKLNEPIEHSVKSLGLSKRTLEGEVVHAYVSLNRAYREYNMSYGDIKIVECVIPRFTIYWLGTVGEIGARKIIPLKFI